MVIQVNFWSDIILLFRLYFIFIGLAFGTSHVAFNVLILLTSVSTELHDNAMSTLLSTVIQYSNESFLLGLESQTCNQAIRIVSIVFLCPFQ